MSRVCIIHDEKSKYPEKSDVFRPSIEYPEYIFQGDLSQDKNAIYEMIRNGLNQLGLDRENFGTKEWNPLGAYVHPGDNVLIKPNMVLHFNAYGGGTDCLYTHPSIVAAMIDYVVIALKGRGRIVVGDAPLQECVFEKLVSDSGYDVLIDFYKSKGIDIELKDFRNVKTEEIEGIHYLQESKGHNGIVVKLDDKSSFAGEKEKRIHDLRITNYDPRILKEHHGEKHHEYMVAKEVLDADVIINMPKPKTHRKAGVTISLKNLVGINANKEYLPHHTIGSKEEGGDAYLHKNPFMTMANQVLDIKNVLVNENEYELAKLADNLYARLREKKNDEEFWEGSWHGNDTIWRTILDLNTILKYADKEGIIREDPQRQMFIVGDMIVSGEKEGPLEPSPIECGCVLLGDDPVAFDTVASSLMGFSYKDIPSIDMPGQTEKKEHLTDGKIPDIISNDPKYDGISLDELKNAASFSFEPSRGWVEKLGSKKLDLLSKEILKINKPVYIFGAGEQGIFVARELSRRKVRVISFCDNNRDIEGKEIWNGIKSILPDRIDKDLPVVVTVKMNHWDSVKKQLEGLGCSIISYI